MKVNLRFFMLFCFLTLLLVFNVTGITIAQEKVKLDLWGWFDWQPTIDSFMKENPNIEVNFVRMGPWDLHDKFLASLAAGSGAPDICTLVNDRFTAYIKTGALVDLTDKIGGKTKDFDKTALSFCLDSQNRVFGLPMDIQPMVVYYRNDVFKEAGVNAENIVTWDDYIKSGQKVVEKSAGKQFPLTTWLPAGQWGQYQFLGFLWSKGINIFNEKGEVIENNTGAMDTLQWYVDLSNKSKISYPQVWFTPTYFGNFKNDTVVGWSMNVADSAVLRQNVPEQSGKWSVIPWPLWSTDAPKYTGNWGGSDVCIPKQSKYQEEAYKFIEFATTNIEGQVANWKGAGLYPAYLPAREPVMEVTDPYFSNQSLAKVATQREVPLFNLPYWAEGSVILGRCIDNVFEGGKTVQEAWANCENEFKEAFKKK
ncbi:MAG: sugar ABC transporter substrate-binding protein [Candidatus Atribacteria bacterium]|nr:sugar ABC transporter substrate-binding protein [Candidatus Atribacteria bacterium]